MTPPPPPRVSGWPQAVVFTAAIITGPACLVLLYRSGASLEAIGGLALVIGGLFAGQFVTARKAGQVDAKQDTQSDTLARVERRVNGDLHTTVATAVEAGIARAVARYREEQARQTDPRGS